MKFGFIFFPVVIAILAIFSYAIFAPVTPGPTRIVLEEYKSSKTGKGFVRTSHYFPCGPVANVFCEGWLYLPQQDKSKSSSLPPVVVLGHGLGAQKDFLLDSYAEKFARDGGLASFVFDYYSFGGSDGEPRNLVNPQQHIADWHRALNFVSEHLSNSVDVNNVFLWGTSFSGGHVIVTSADPRYHQQNRKIQLRAVVSQVPFLKYELSLLAETTFKSLILTNIAVLRDLIRSLFSLSPHYIKVAGDPGDVAALTSPECALFFALIPEKPLGGWENLMPARAVAKVFSYSPMDSILTPVPVLFAPAKSDSVCPFSIVQRAVEQRLAKLSANLTSIRTIDGTHFDVYVNDGFEYMSQQQLQFFLDHVQH